MTAVLLTPPYLQFVDNNGAPLAGGLVYTYIAGTGNQPKATYTDASGTIPATNPIILDSAGRAVIWITGSYDIKVTDALGNIIDTTANITAFNTTANAAPSFFERFSGTGTQTVFTLTQDLGTDNNSIQVFVNNGTVTAGTTGTLSAPFFQKFTSITSQTVFNLTEDLGTNSNAIQVFVLNSTKGYDVLAPAGYTLTSGASPTLTLAVSPTAATDSVYVFDFGQNLGFQVLDPNSYTLADTSLTLAKAPVAGTNNILVFCPSTLVAAASASAAQAAGYATAAQVSANTAAQQATSFTGTSTTSVTVGTGTKTFTTQTNKNFLAGEIVQVASASNVNTFMAGTVQSYNSASGVLIIAVPSTFGNTGNSGSTAADWNISLSGVQGIPGQVGTGVADMKNQTFVSGTDYTAGTSTTLTLTNTPIAASKPSLYIDFDAANQQPSEWSYDIVSGIITFNSPIPVGVSQVFCYWFANIAVGTPSDGTVTATKMASGAAVNGQTPTANGSGGVVYRDHYMTTQYLLSGTTYTTPANCRKIKIKMVGGGGGGGGFGSGTNGGNGTATTFNSIAANPGGGGIAGASGSAGAGGASGTGTADYRQTGGLGFSGIVIASKGGDSRMGPGAAGVVIPGNSAMTNTGGGGQGGGSNSTTVISAGAGGSGEYVEVSIVSPATNYTYAIGTGGTGGTGSTAVGGNGGSGLIIVEEYY